MPAKLNVGASRKIADGRYGSRGASVNLEIELDHAVVSEPAKLLERIRQIFHLVHQALTDELQRGQTASSPNRVSSLPSNNQRPATIAQVKTIRRLASEMGTDLEESLRQPFGVQRPEELTVQQASNIIDTLKAARINSAA